MSGLQRMLAVHQVMANEGPDDSDALEGVVVAGSWDASEGVCQVLIGDTVGYESPFFSDGNQPLMPICRIVNPGIGDQYAPVGGERAIVWQGQSGHICKLVHGPDDTSLVPSGERWIRHRSAAISAPNVPSGQDSDQGAYDSDRGAFDLLPDLTDAPIPVAWDSGIKLTNDASTPGDRLGGAHFGLEGALTQSETASGARHTIDDTAQKIESVTALGLTMGSYDQVKQIVHSVVAGQLETIIDGVTQRILHQASPEVYTKIDALGEEIAHVVPAGTGKIGLGDLFENLPSASAAINQDILSDFGDNVNQFGLTNFAALVTLFKNAGAITPTQASTIIAGIILSWLEKVAVPDGSPIVRIAS